MALIVFLCLSLTYSPPFSAWASFIVSGVSAPRVLWHPNNGNNIAQTPQALPQVTETPRPSQSLPPSFPEGVAAASPCPRVRSPSPWFHLYTGSWAAPATAARLLWVSCPSSPPFLFYSRMGRGQHMSSLPFTHGEFHYWTVNSNALNPPFSGQFSDSRCCRFLRLLVHCSYPHNHIPSSAYSGPLSNLGLGLSHSRIKTLLSADDKNPYD